MVKRVMFICHNNSALSQMAEGFAQHLGVGSIQVTSAGLEVSKVHPAAISAMNDAGIDIRRQTSKALHDFRPENFDVIIALGDCGGRLSQEWRTRELFEDWQFDDAAVQSEHVPDIRDEIRVRVIRLIELIDVRKNLRG